MPSVKENSVSGPDPGPPPQGPSPVVQQQQQQQHAHQGPPGGPPGPGPQHGYPQGPPGPPPQQQQQQQQHDQYNMGYGGYNSKSGYEPHHGGQQHNMNNIDMNQQQQQHYQQHYPQQPPPMRFPGKPLPGQVANNVGQQPPPGQYPPPPQQQQMPRYNMPGQPPNSNTTPTLNHLLQTSGGGGAGAPAGGGGHRYPPPPGAGYDQHQQQQYNMPPNKADYPPPGPGGWPPPQHSSGARPQVNPYGHPPQHHMQQQQQQQQQHQMYRPPGPGSAPPRGPGPVPSPGGPPPPGHGQQQQQYYGGPPMHAPPPASGPGGHPGYPPPSQSPHHNYPPPQQQHQPRYPGPPTGAPPGGGGHYPPPPQPGMPADPSSSGPTSNSNSGEPPKSAPSPAPSPSLAQQQGLSNHHGNSPESPQQSPRSTPLQSQPPGGSSSSSSSSNNSGGVSNTNSISSSGGADNRIGSTTTANSTNRPQGVSPSTNSSYSAPNEVGDVTGCNSNDSGPNAGGMRPSPSPTGSGSGSRSMSPAVGNQNIPPRPPSGQSEVPPRMSQSPMQGSQGPYQQQPMAPPQHHMYPPSAGKHGQSPGGPHYGGPPPPQQHWQQQPGGPPPGPGQYGRHYYPPQGPGPQGGPPPNNYQQQVPRHPNHVQGPNGPNQYNAGHYGGYPPSGQQGQPLPPPHGQPGWPPAAGGGAPPNASRSQQHVQQQQYLKHHLQAKMGYGQMPPHGQYPGHMGPPPGGMPPSSPSATPPPQGPHGHLGPPPPPHMMHEHGAQTHLDAQEGSSSGTNSVNLGIGPDGTPVDEGSQQSTISNASGASGGDDGPTMPKLKKEGSHQYQSHPATPSSMAVPSPGAGSMNSMQEDYNEGSSPGWPRTPASPGVNHPSSGEPYNRLKGKKSDSLNKLYDMDDNPERRPFLDKLLGFMEEYGSPITTCPQISKTPLDLYKLYFAVKERGGFIEVSKNKTWKDVAGIIGIGASSSAAYTLRKHYSKHVLPFECKFDRGGIDPSTLISQVESHTKKGKAGKAVPVPSPGSSNSQDSFPGPNNSTSSMDGFSNFPSPYPPSGSNQPSSDYNQANSPHQRTTPSSNAPGAPAPPQSSPHQGGDRTQISVSNPFDDVQPGSQFGSTQHSQYQHQQHHGYPNATGAGYPSYPGQNDQYGRTPQGPGPHEGYPGYNAPQPSGYPSAPGAPGRPMYPPYGASGDGSGPPPQSGYPGQPGQGASSGPPMAPPSHPGTGYPTHPSSRSPYAPNQQPPPNGYMHQPDYYQNQSTDQLPSLSSRTQHSKSNSSPSPTTVSDPLKSALHRLLLDRSDNNRNASKKNETLTDNVADMILGKRHGACNGYSGGPPPPSQGKQLPGHHQQPGQMRYPPGPPKDGAQPGQPFYPPGQNAQQSPQQRMPPYDANGQPSGRPGYMYGQAGPGNASMRSSPSPNVPPLAPPPALPASSHTAHGSAVAPPSAAPATQVHASKQWIPPEGWPSSPYQGQQGPQRPYAGQAQQPGQGPPIPNSTTPTPPGPPGTPPQTASAQPPWASRQPTGPMPPPGQAGSWSSGGQGGYGAGPMPPSGPPNAWNKQHPMPMGARPKAPYGPGPDFGQASKGMLPPPGAHPLGPGSGPMVKAGHPPPMGMPPQGPPHQHYPGQQMQMMPGGPMHGHHGKKEMLAFPPDSVEAVTPVITKRRKLHKNDVAPVEPWRIMMCLKSGLLAETTWSLDVLNVLLYDDHSVSYFSLSYLPGLLDLLLEHLRRNLILMFGSSVGLDESVYVPSVSASNNNKKIEFEKEERNSRKELGKRKWYEITRASLPSEHDIGIPDGKTLPGISTVVLNGTNFTNVTRGKKKRTVKFVLKEEEPFVFPEPRDWDIDEKLRMSDEQELGQSNDPMGSTQHVITHFTSELNIVPVVRVLSPSPDSMKAEDKTEVEVKSDEPVSTDEAKSTKPLVNGDVNLEEEDMDLGDPAVKPKKAKLMPKVNCVKTTALLEEITKVKVNSKLNNVIAAIEKRSVVETEVIEEDVKPIIESSITAEGKAEETEGGKNGTSEEERPDVKMETANEDPKENGEVAKSPEAGDQQNDVFKVKVHDPVAELRKIKLEDFEDECYTRDEPSLYLIGESQDSLGRRCLSVFNIIRNLTFVPGNELEFGKNQAILSLLGKLILLHHEHPVKGVSKSAATADELEAAADAEVTLDEDEFDAAKKAAAAAEAEASLHQDEEWWWDYLHHIREHVLVIIANISGHMDLSTFSEEISRPILDGLLHWAVCPSAYGQDPFPTVGPGSHLSPQRLAIEALCKLSVTQGNVDLLLATPPYSRVERLCTLLTRFLCGVDDPVMREFAINLLGYLSGADSGVARTIALQNPCISLLISFIEQAEANAMNIANNHGFNVLRENPEAMGTSLDMLRRAATILLNLAKHPDNRALFVQHEPRLLQLVMSQILEQKVASLVAQVLYQCSLPESSVSSNMQIYGNNDDLFYTPSLSRSRGYNSIPPSSMLPHHHIEMQRSRGMLV